MTGASTAPGPAELARRRYTDAQRAEAIELYRTDGPTAAQTRLGIPKGTVARWAKETGVETVSNAKNATAVEASHIHFAQRRTDLAHGLLDDVEKLRDQLFAKAKVHHFDKDGDFHEAELDEPTFGDKRAILTSIGIAVDKVQLLSGGATGRTESVNRAEIPERAGKLDEVAAQRAKRDVA